jgi:hypothetical protein
MACLMPIRAADCLREWLFNRDQRDNFVEEIEIGREASVHAQHDDIESEWTMSMSFYALSGGCTYRGQDRVPHVLGKAAIEFLVVHDPKSLLPLRRAALQNPGKADAFAKAITCAQILWFCLHLVARLSNHTAVALAELVTFAHCIAALLIYIFWWDKPYNVESHVDIECTSLDLAWSLYQSKIMHITFEMSQTKEPDQAPQAGTGSVTTIDEHGEKIFQNAYNIENSNKDDVTSSVELLNSHGTFEIPDTGFRLSVKRPDLSEKETFAMPQTFIDQWQVLWRHWVTMGRPKSASVLPCSDVSAWFPHRAFNIVYWGKGDDLIIRQVAICVPVAAYGCLHLLAWNYDFTTSAERTLWRIASAATVAGGINGMILYVGKLLYHRFFDTTEPPSFLGSLAVIVLAFIGLPLGFLALTCLAPLVVLARTFLIIESFKALPNSPPSTYLVPEWTTFIPHFG